MKKISTSQLLYRLSAFLITLLSIFYFVKTAMYHFSEIPDLTWGFLTFAIAVICVALVVISIAFGGVIWRILLIDIGASVNWKDTLVVFLITQFAKYLPGNIGHHVGRVFMGREIGIPASITLSTMLIEIVWVIAISAGLTVLSLLLFVDGQSVGFYRQIGPISLCFFVGFLFFMPWFGIAFLNKFLPNLVNRFAGCDRIPSPKFTTALSVGVLFFIAFVLMGVILKLQAQYLFGVTAGSVFQLTCLFSIAWLAGYLSPGAPGGFGVREAMMVLLLSPLFGEGTAVGLGVTLRVTTTVGDAVAFALGVLVRRAIS